MTETRPINTAERKSRILRLRTRLKWAIGAYHLFGEPRRMRYATFDGLTPGALKRWTDAVIDNLRRPDTWHFHVFLVNLCVSASDEHRKAVNQGLYTEATIYEPAVSVYIQAYRIPADEAWKLLDQAIDAAVRYWLLEEPVDAR